jgi:multimeric flavodoxin WrbA
MIGMKISIFNGNPTDESNGFDAYLERLAVRLRSPDGGGHEVNELKLRNLNAKPCVGCFGCWLKTPGRCILKDDSELTGRAMATSDFVLFAYPLVMGFTTSLMRWASEKLIITLLPYFSVIKGEVRHKWRYKSKPRLGVLLQREEDTDDEDIEINRSVFEQMSRESQTRLMFVMDTYAAAEEVADAINRN